jgi:hypothetical protein
MHGVEGDNRVCVRCPGTHLGGNPYRFHEFLLGRAFLPREFRVAADAVGGLRDMRDAIALSVVMRAPWPP